MKVNFSSLKIYVNTEIQKLHNVFSPILHNHGNITSNGMIGDSNNNANKNVVTDENGQITIEEKTEGLDSFNYGYIDENLQCHLIKVEEINILSADSQLSPSEDFNLSGEIITDDETNNPIAVKIYLNNNYLETVYTYGYDKSFDFSIEDSELVSGENTIKMQCGNVVVEHTCLLSQDVLTLTSDKNILSQADNDVATITATYNANDNSGKVVTFSGAEMTTTVSSEGWLTFGNEATVSNIQMGELKLIYLGRRNNCLYISRTSSTQYRIYVLRQGDTYVVNDGKIDISQGFSYSGDTFTYTNNTGTVCTFDISGLDKQLAGDSNVSFTVTSTTVSAVTDSNGVATVSYNSQGAGDVTITAECMSLQETYNIEDCYLVDENEYHATGNNYTRILPDFSFPNTNWEISSNFKETHNGGQFGVADITSPTTQKDYVSSVKQGNNYYLSGLDGVTDGSQELWNRSTVYMSSIYYPVKIKHEDGTLYYYFNGTLMDTHTSSEFNAVSNLGLFFRGYYRETNTYVKDIKIKKL